MKEQSIRKLQNAAELFRPAFDEESPRTSSESRQQEAAAAPTASDEGTERVQSWLDQPCVRLHPSEQHGISSAPRRFISLVWPLGTDAWPISSAFGTNWPCGSIIAR
ncbi:MAG TPA: hypothetical protein DCE44_22855 [Verrucomicrobiales bacterium]|nr:hypothetical protein [Verrucomicrobiales bacterium]